MSGKKIRVTITLDPELVRLGNGAVRRGDAGSLSEWINTTLEERAMRARRERAGRRATAEFQRTFGPISKREMARLAAEARQGAIRTRARSSRSPERAA